ncbi:MAG: GlsB/YeaQ/YmgE family stress response membrane protein [Boseongicola sp.]
MAFIWFIVIGLAAGWLAGRIMEQDRGMLANLVVGVVGAFIGGFLGRVIGLTATSLIGSLILATLGAVVLLWVVGRMGK